MKEVLRLQGRKLPFEQPEKTYKEFLVKKYNQLVGTPKWAELDRKEEEGSEEDSDNEILRVCFKSEDYVFVIINFFSFIYFYGILFTEQQTLGKTKKS